jgi:trk system potassium uptake protein TrkA
VKENWVGKTLVELNLRKKYTINIVAIRDGKNINTSIDPELPLQECMRLIVIAQTEKLKKLK